jgi:hypothetical protein
VTGPSRSGGQRAGGRLKEGQQAGANPAIPGGKQGGRQAGATGGAVQPLPAAAMRCCEGLKALQFKSDLPVVVITANEAIKDDPKVDAVICTCGVPGNFNLRVGGYRCGAMCGARGVPSTVNLSARNHRFDAICGTCGVPDVVKYSGQSQVHAMWGACGVPARQCITNAYMQTHDQ